MKLIMNIYTSDKFWKFDTHIKNILIYIYWKLVPHKSTIEYFVETFNTRDKLNPITKNPQHL